MFVTGRASVDVERPSSPGGPKGLPDVMSVGELPRGSRPILRFCAGWLLAFGLLMFPWPGLSAAYAAFYRRVAGATLEIVWPGGHVEFAAQPDARGSQDSAFTVRAARGRHRISLRSAIDSHVHGYLPTAFAIALALATPVAARRRVAMLTITFITVNGYVVARAVFFVVLLCSGDKPESIFQVGSAMEAARVTCAWVVFNSLVGHFCVPIAVWIVALRLSARAKRRVMRRGRRARTGASPAHLEPVGPG